VVEFKTNDNAGDPLPDPMLLRLRAYTTQCAFSKAAGEKTGQVWYDEEEDIAAGSMFDEAKTFFYGHSEDQYTDARDDEESNVLHIVPEISMQTRLHDWLENVDAGLDPLKAEMKAVRTT
jgi:hypothetical protein